MARPLRELEGPVAALWSDLDGTLTSGGRLEAATLAALEALETAGIPLVVVTGRSAGWGQAILDMTPTAAVIAENGGVTFQRTGSRVIKRYGLPERELTEGRRQMDQAFRALVAQLPAARLSSDSVYREVDLAIDWNEELHLEVEVADRMVDFLRERGLAASRSSVHVNFAPPGFDKLTACRAAIPDVVGGDPDDLARHVYVGDALNDAPMFAAFPRAVGVANVAVWWDALPEDARPGYLTEGAEGAGVRELIARLLELGPV